MLKVWRNKFEKIIVEYLPTGEQIEIVVWDVAKNWRVQIGVEADQSFSINREEIHEAKKAEGKI